MKIIRDFYNRIEPSRIYLATTEKKILCALNSVDIESVNFTGKSNDVSSLSFDLNQYIEGYNNHLILANGYNLVSKYMRLFVTNIGWFIMDTPEIHHNGTHEYKTINALSAQCEYNQIPLDTWKVNRGTTDSLEMLIDDNVEEIEGVEFAKENIKFHYPEKPQLSLVDILVSKVPGWKVGYVDQIPKEYESIENGQFISKSVLLADEIGTFDIDYGDCYSFMVQDLEKYFHCIVEFDYFNFVVNFYRVENYGKDTNVTIGFRNVENSNDITIDEDNIFTKFRVSGGDNLGIEQFNGGSNYLIFLSDYWLNEKYLSKSTIEKYKKWYYFCYTARYEYGELSKQWNILQDEISELNTRVPISDCNPENWSQLNDDELLVLKSDYEAQKLGYEKAYVDEDGNFDEEALQASTDANTYYQIVNTILPNIDIEIANRDLPTSEGETDFLEQYLTNWEYYGVNELSIKLTSYQDLANLLKKSHYDLSWERYQELSQEDPENYPVLTSDGFQDKHDEYLKNAQQLDELDSTSCAYALKERQKEVDEKTLVQEEINQKRSDLAKIMSLEGWDGTEAMGKYTYLLDENGHWLQDDDGNFLVELNVYNTPFTQKELLEIYHILNQTPYTNENIFVSSTDSLTDTVTIQQQLCETAIDDIQVYSTPQTIYTTSMDNILSISGNELHAKDLDYGNFIRLEIREGYFVKLRVTSISYNPLLYDNNFSIQFSNMVKAGKKRNDFVSLLNLSNNLSQSSASTSYSANIQITDDNIYQILQKLLQNSLFNSKLQNIINQNINSGTSTGGYLTPGDIYGNNGFFEYIQAELIAAGQIVADSADFKELKALVAQIDDLIAGNVSAELGHIIKLTAENVAIDEAVIRDLIASQITVSMLQAGTISANKFNIASDDGGMTIVGNTMQFKDQDGNLRIQIGRDTNNDFTFVLYDTSGTGVLIDSTGIKESAISDGLIQTDMVADNAITESKINKTGMREWTDEDGKKIFDVGKMYFGDDKFETSYNQTVSKVNNVYDRVDDLYTKIGSIELSGEQIFKDVSGNITPHSITIFAKCINGVIVGKWYIDDTENTEYVSQDKTSLTIPSSFMADKNVVTVKVVDSTEKLYDTCSIYRLTDTKGDTGQAAISVIITSEKGTVFPEDTNITETICSCAVFEGTKEITPKSYQWYLIDDDSEEWKECGTEQTITIPLDFTIVRKRLKCDVDIDIAL